MQELYTAVRNGDSEKVNALVAADPSLGVFAACVLGDVAELERLLNGNRSLVSALSSDGWTPLHLAAFFGHRETAEALLDAGADVLAVARNGEANLPINAAAAGPRADRRPEIVRLLIARGSPVDGRGSPGGHTPLHEAAYNGDVPLARVLLASGADSCLQTGDGQTALDLATQQGRLEAVRLLGGPGHS